MGLLSRFNPWSSVGKGSKKPGAPGIVRGFRKCQVERVELRRLMASDVVQLGSVYFEDGSGEDEVGDTIQITFDGGPAGVRMNELTINTDKEGNGLTNGDTFFDISAGGLGAFRSVPLVIDRARTTGLNVDAIQFSVSDGGQLLHFTFTDFDPGDRLVFTVDVDEQGFLSPNAVAEGNEWEGTQLTGVFTAPHYFSGTGEAIYYDAYDPALEASGLNLPRDDYAPPLPLANPIYSAGAFAPLTLDPLPVSICGRVFEDVDLDNVLDNGEPGLDGVTLDLLEWNGSEYVSTGLTTTTDENGEYCFLGLDPGKYKVMETTPEGYFDVGAQRGNVDGVDRGSVIDANCIAEIELLGGEDSLENNFGEARPASIRGRVFADSNDNCVFEPGDEPIGGVTIWLLDANGQRVRSTTTDATGQYAFEGLAPGVYGVEEEHPSEYIDHDSEVGDAGGEQIGTGKLVGARLLSGTNATEYNFCEFAPASIAGVVFADLDDDCVLDQGETPLAGVTVWLLDANGQRVRSTTTDNSGHYEFKQLAPGVYGVEEEQPSAYLDGGAVAGTSAGTTVIGTSRLGNIALSPGEDAVENNFCEIPPARIDGNVFSDLDGDCVFDPNTQEQRLAGVTVWLTDAQGQRIRSTTTDASGHYEFTNLEPGVYGVEEEQPNGYYEGGAMAGSSAGTTVLGASRLGNIVLSGGESAVENNFCEVPPARLDGYVFSDLDGDCVFDPNTQERMLSGVTVWLTDANGVQIHTTTDASGHYEFTNLAPGVYSVEEEQPAGYFEGGSVPGTINGVTVGEIDSHTDSKLSNIRLEGGQASLNNNFCEIPPASISGFVFIDGAPIMYEQGTTPTEAFDLTGIRDGERTSDDTALAGIRMVLANVNGVPIRDAAGNQISTVTNAQGFYRFTGLVPGQYTVLAANPNDDTLFDGIDTPGTTGGQSFNFLGGVRPDPGAEIPEYDPGFDYILGVKALAGQESFENNFSEVQVEETPPPPPRDPVVINQTQYVSTPGGASPVLGLFSPPILPTQPPVSSSPGITLSTPRGGPGKEFTWHLSVVNAGQPRAAKQRENALVQNARARMNKVNWASRALDRGQWVLDRDGDGRPETYVFGAADAIPVTGDFDGDGRTEIGVYLHGEWFLDFNANARWDGDDLWAELGTEVDLPVTGDWDGDGKSDIGIFGPQWNGDLRAIEAEPGLPDANNSQITNVRKNVPPQPDDATIGLRVMKRSSDGVVRGDLIDHVFQYGEEGDVPVTGDWNGDGIRSIGIFRDGVFALDTNANGRIDYRDERRNLKQSGLPVVGDFDGDGIDEVGVYTAGTWRIDSDHNGKLDAHDRVFEMGGAGDRPVTGDWNGDGTDDPGVYRGGTSQVSQSAPRLRPAS